MRIKLSRKVRKTAREARILVRGLGYLGIIFIPIILIVAAIAIPNLLRARIAANEASAAASVRELVSAEISYHYSATAVRSSDSLLSS